MHDVVMIMGILSKPPLEIDQNRLVNPLIEDYIQ